jgi:lipooligosaccharide transport system ATP-binding protein
MDEAEELCDRLVIMEKGRILVEDQPRKLIDDVVGTGVISIYQPDDTVIALAESRGWSYERTIDAIFIYTDDTAEALTVIKERTSANNATVRNATLEDVFLRLTGRGLRD